MIMTDFNYLFIVVLFVLIHYIYNIAIGFQASLGQRLFKIEPKFDFTNSLSVAFLLRRSTLELLSILTLGIPYLVKLDVELLENKPKNFDFNQTTQTRLSIPFLTPKTYIPGLYK